MISLLSTPSTNIRTVCRYIQRHLPIAVAVAFSLLSAGYLTLFSSAEERDTRKMLAFSDPDLSKPKRWINNPDLAASLSTGELRGVRAWAGGYTPIIRWSNVHHFSFRQEALFLAPDLSYSRTSKTPRPAEAGGRMLWLPASVLLAWFGAHILVRASSAASMALGLACLRIAFLFFVFVFFGFYSVHSNDESAYREVLRKLADWSGDPHAGNSRTIGLPLLLLPLQLLFPEVSDFSFAAIAGSLFFPVAALILPLLALTLLRNHGVPFRTLLWAGLVLVLYPAWVRVFSRQGRYFSLALDWFSAPSDYNPLSFYMLSDLIGFTSLSDTPALLFGLASLTLLAKQAFGTRSLLLAGALWGFSCMIRIGNIFYALPLFYLLWRRYGRGVIRPALTALGTCALVFSPQLLWNQHFFQNPFRFGYAVEIPTLGMGFEFSRLISGFSLLGATHFQVMAWSIVALLSLPRNHRPLTILFALCIAPTLVFVSGCGGVPSPIAQANPVRHLLLPLTAMLLLTGVWLKSIVDTREAILASLLVLSSLLISPVLPYAVSLLPLPLWVGKTLWGGLALSALMCRRNAYAVSFALLCIGYGCLTTVVLLICCLWRLVPAAESGLFRSPP